MDNDNTRDVADLYTRADVSNIRADKREVDVIASTEALDDHGTRLIQDWNLERFMKNPVALFGHDRSSLPVGTVSKIKVEGSKGRGDKRLTATVKFRDEGKSQRADEVWEAVADGTLRGISVGFRPHSQRVVVEDGREIIELSQLELYEISFVPLPSNPDTLAGIRARALAEHHKSSPPETGPANKDDQMDLTVFARALGLDENAVATDIEARIAANQTERQALIDATGESTYDAALGAIEAGRAAITELANMQEKALQNERQSIVDTLKREGKLTPAQERDFVPSLSLDGLKAFAKSAPKVLGDSGLREASLTDIGTNQLRYESMSGSERAALKKSDSEMFEAVRSDWLARGKPSKAA